LISIRSRQLAPHRGEGDELHGGGGAAGMDDAPPRKLLRRVTKPFLDESHSPMLILGAPPGK